MTIEEIKLCSVYRKSIKSIEESIERLRSEMERTTQVLSHAPTHTGNRDKLAEQVRRMMELETARANEVADMEEHIDRCRIWLLNLPEQQASILTYRHIYGLPWEQVAQKVGYSKHHCYKIYEAALCRLKMDTQ